MFILNYSARPFVSSTVLPIFYICIDDITKMRKKIDNRMIKYVYITLDSDILRRYKKVFNTSFFKNIT